MNTRKVAARLFFAISAMALIVVLVYPSLQANASCEESDCHQITEKGYEKLNGTLSCWQYDKWTGEVVFSKMPDGGTRTPFTPPIKRRYHDGPGCVLDCGAIGKLKQQKVTGVKWHDWVRNCIGSA